MTDRYEEIADNFRLSMSGNAAQFIEHYRAAAGAQHSEDWYAGFERGVEIAMNAMTEGTIKAVIPHD